MTIVPNYLIVRQLLSAREFRSVLGLNKKLLSFCSAAVIFDAENKKKDPVYSSDAEKSNKTNNTNLYIRNCKKKYERGRRSIQIVTKNTVLLN